MNTKSTQGGFSLLEMMIVVAVISILVGLLAPNLMSQLRKAETIRVTTDINTIEQTAKFYYLDNYRMPNNVRDLTPRYLSETPRDPWGNEYTYRVTARGYKVCSLGSDGRQGGTRSAKDICRKVNVRGYR